MRWLLPIWPIVAAVVIVTWFPHLPLAWYLIIWIVFAALPSVVRMLHSRWTSSRWTSSRWTHARGGRASD